VIPDPLAPSGLSELSAAEHGLLIVFRSIVAGHDQKSALRWALKVHCGPQSGEVIEILRVFIHRVAVQGRREVVISPPGAAGLTRDEQLILAVFASAQSSDFTRLNAHLSYLLGRTPDAGFIAGACVVADIVHRNGGILRSSPPSRLKATSTADRPRARPAAVGGAC